MLPMFDKKRIVSLIAMKRGKPGVEVANEKEMGESPISEGLKEAATDILGAIERKSVLDLAKAIKAAFEIMEEEPHEEGPHIEEEMGE